MSTQIPAKVISTPACSSALPANDFAQCALDAMAAYEECPPLKLAPQHGFFDMYVQSGKSIHDPHRLIGLISGTTNVDGKFAGSLDQDQAEQYDECVSKKRKEYMGNGFLTMVGSTLGACATAALLMNGLSFGLGFVVCAAVVFGVAVFSVVNFYLSSKEEDTAPYKASNQAL